MAIQILATFMVLDYVTGITKAIYNKKLNSEVGFKGILKKFGELVVVMVGVGIDTYLNTGGFMRELVIYYIVLTEALSILENLAIIGVPFPKKLKDTLEQLKKEKEEVSEKV